MPAHLFDPLRLGPITLGNRTIRAAAFEGMSPDHLASPALVELHRAVAAGGVGMTTVAYAAVEQSGLSFPHQLWLRPAALPGLRALTDAVHREGALASIQIGHCGDMAHRKVAGERPLAPSARLNLYGPNWPRAMDAERIARVVRSFGEATTLARDAGFDAVEVHAGHGYLISQFLSPATNRRRDAYGGDLAGRARFMREALAAALRAADGAIAVIVKMNLRDGFAGGIELEEAIEVARILERDGADALVLSGGFVSRAPMFILRGAMPTALMARWIDERWLRLGVRLLGPALIPAVPYEDAYFLADAVAVRAAVRLPLIYVGGVTSRATADRVLAAGFDGIALARALLREPDFVRRLAAEEAAASPCDHCNYCAARIYTRAVACHHRIDVPAAEARLLRAIGAR